MNVTTGTLQHTIITRNDSATFISFLAEIDASTPTGLDIHLVMDNGSSHKSKATRAWLKTHPRFPIHRTPVHSSWLNMVEIWFSILTSKVLHRGEFTNREHLSPEHHRLPRPLQHHRHTLPLDLRRPPPPSRMTPKD